jgi:general secretion pathway protein M
MMKITPRDRLVLTVGSVVLLLFLILQFGIFPLMDNRDRLKRGIAAREKALVEMSELQVQYRQLSGKANVLLDQLVGRQDGFSLFSFLEQMAAKSEVKKNITYMKPSETPNEGPFKEVLVEMKLQAVTLKQLVDFLNLAESPENVVALKRISIQENTQEKATLDVIVQVVSLDRNPEAGVNQGL